MTSYLSDSVAWSAFWGMTGYVICYLQMTFLDKRRKRKMTDQVQTPSTTAAKRSLPFRLYVFFAVIGLGMVGQQYIFQREQDDDDRADEAAKQCLIEQVSDITKAFQARADINGRISENTEKVITTVSSELATQDIQRIQKALDTYVGTSAELKKERRMNPVPPFPNGKCDVK